MKGTWMYGSKTGPEHWHEQYPVAKEGKRQSPIDIKTDVAKNDEKLRQRPLKYSYVPNNVKEVENTGASWRVNVDGAGSCLTGGPLHDEYELWQFHAHWGEESSAGSEHTVDGKSCAAEVHLVHWNRSKYSSPNEAAGEPDGLAVLGILIESGQEVHPEFDKLCQLLPRVQHAGEKAAFKEPIDPAKLLPQPKSSQKDLQYWTYEGSLTTPPLLESVIWIVFKEHVQLTEGQLNTMRQLSWCSKDEDTDCPDAKMVNNYRPTISLGSRELRRN